MAIEGICSCVLPPSESVKVWRFVLPFCTLRHPHDVRLCYVYPSVYLRVRGIAVIAARTARRRRQNNRNIRRKVFSPSAPCTRCTSQVDGTGNGNGVGYSIAARVMEQYPGPGELQVQVRYGDRIEDILENMPSPDDAPEWSSTPSSQEFHQGGREIMLDVS